MVKVKERRFTDLTGDNLIIHHRKSAVIFLRETDVNVAGWVSPFWSDPTPAVQPSEIERTYQFSSEGFRELFDYLYEIAHEAWPDFLLQEVNSFRSDFSEYYDRKAQNNGYLSFKADCGLIIKGPLQDKTDEAVVRIYQFNKRKFEAFLDVFQKRVISH